MTILNACAIWERYCRAFFGRDIGRDKDSERAEVEEEASGEMSHGEIVMARDDESCTCATHTCRGIIRNWTL